jgi:hypothetical protein
MLQAAKDIIPGMLMKAEACMMRRWSKGAYDAYDKDGRMIPYEDAEKNDDNDAK